MTAKRYRHPKLQPGELCLEWGKMPRDGWDVIYHCADKETQRRDLALLHYHFSSLKPTLRGTLDPSFIEELTARGYDIQTIQFSIKKKVPT